MPIGHRIMTKQITSSRIHPSSKMEEGAWHFARTGGKEGTLYHKFKGVLYQFLTNIIPTGDDVGDVLTSFGRGNLRWHDPHTDKFWTFDSPQGTSGTFYYGGHYKFHTTNNDFSGGPSFGTVNSPYGGHFFIVLGAATVDVLTLRVTGTSITDAGVRTTSDTEDIVIPSGISADAYYETDIKWLGAVVITVVSGTAKACNYGYTKYWDDHNQDFRLTGFEALWLGGANDAGADIKIRHHSAIGWTYNAGSTPTPPAEIVSMVGDYSTESDVKNGEHGSWKRDNLSTLVRGAHSEGLILEVITTANKTFEISSLQAEVKEL